MEIGNRNEVKRKKEELGYGTQPFTEENNLLRSLLGGEVLLALLKGELLERETLRLDILLGLLGVLRLGADGGVGLLVDLLEVISGDTSGNVLRELALVGLGILLLEELHVGSDVSTEDVLAEDGGVELGVLGIFLIVEISSQTALRVRNIETSISGTLHGTEDTVTSRGTGQTDIEQNVEGTRSVIRGLDNEVLSVSIDNTNVLVGHLELGQSTTGQQQTGRVRSGVVGQTSLDSERGQLVGIGSGQDDISLHLSVHDLGNDVLVREANNQTELGSSILVQILNNQVLTSLIVSETLFSFQFQSITHNKPSSVSFFALLSFFVFLYSLLFSLFLLHSLSLIKRFTYRVFCDT